MDLAEFWENQNMARAIRFEKPFQQTYNHLCHHKFRYYSDRYTSNDWKINLSAKNMFHFSLFQNSNPPTYYLPANLPAYPKIQYPKIDLFLIYHLSAGAI